MVCPPGVASSLLRPAGGEVFGEVAGFVELVGGVAGADEEAFNGLAALGVFEGDVDRGGGGLHGDLADVLAVEGAEADGETGSHRFAHFFEQQVVHQPQLKAVGILFALLEGLVVGLQAQDGAIVGDTDQQGAAVGVEEGGDG
nr:hypothetical protein [Leptolyngbya sp. PCC 6406]